MHTLNIGDKAYFDSFCGMVPCKVTEIDRQITAPIVVKAIVTTNHGYYKRGSVIASHSRIVPRTAVKFRKYGTFVQQFTIAGE